MLIQICNDDVLRRTQATVALLIVGNLAYDLKESAFFFFAKVPKIYTKQDVNRGVMNVLQRKTLSFLFCIY